MGTSGRHESRVGSIGLLTFGAEEVGYEMSYLPSDGAPVSMSMDYILNGLDDDCHRRLEAFWDCVNSDRDYLC